MKKTLKILSPSGVLDATLSYDGTARQDLYILMHGFMSSQRYRVLRQLRTMLTAKGHAVLMFDFDGHGRSEGRFRDMTVLSCLDDARAVLAVASTWPWVGKIHLVGHSQGGVVAGMLAGESGASKIASLIQLAPAAVLHDDALEGHVMNAKYDPDNLPETVRVFFVKKVGRAYFQVAQQLDIYGRSCTYDGPVCLIHGTDDTIVPFRYSECYHALYPHSELHPVEGDNHMLYRHTPEVVRLVGQFVG